MWRWPTSMMRLHVSSVPTTTLTWPTISPQALWWVALAPSIKTYRRSTVSTTNLTLRLATSLTMMQVKSAISSSTVRQTSHLQYTSEAVHPLGCDEISSFVLTVTKGYNAYSHAPFAYLWHQYSWKHFGDISRVFSAWNGWIVDAQRTLASNIAATKPEVF